MTDVRTSRVLIQHRPLPPELHPVHVVRHDGVCIIAIDPSTTRSLSAQAMMRLMTDDEINALRAALGEPPIGQPADPKWFTDDPIVGPESLPPSLVLPRRSQPVDVRTAREMLRDRTRAARKQALKVRSDGILRRAMLTVPTSAALVVHDAGTWAGRLSA